MEFKTNSDIQGLPNFAVPSSGPALMGYGPDDWQISVTVDPDGELGPVDKIVVAMRNEEDADDRFVKSFPDTSRGYSDAKRYARSLVNKV